MILRPYQQEAIDRTRAALRSGGRSVVVVIPTGGGKTAVGATMAASSVAKGRRVLWLAHRRELQQQARGALDAAGATAAQVASLDALVSRGERPDADVVFFDEVHHACAPTYADLMGSYLGRATCIGFTATPQRGDGKGLGAAGWERMVCVTSIRELTDAGHLVPCDIVAPKAPLRPGEIATSPLDAYRAHCDGRSTLVYAPNLRAADEWRTAFVDAGVRAELVHGGTNGLARASWLALFRDGVLPVLINVGVLTEGTDIPRASCAIVARGVGTVGLWLQICGRVLRPFEGKDRATVVDLRGMCHELGHPAEDRAWTLEGRAARTAADVVDATYCQVCGAIRVAGTAACEECGFELEYSPVKVTGAKLDKWDHFRRQDPVQRAETLARWLRAGRSKGYRDGWAMAKYAAVYGSRPGSDVLTDALRRAR